MLEISTRTVLFTTCSTVRICFSPLRIRPSAAITSIVISAATGTTIYNRITIRATTSSCYDKYTTF